MKKSKKKIFNPFEGRDREQVWSEVREKAQPISREEAMQKVKEASLKQQKGK